MGRPHVWMIAYLSVCGYALLIYFFNSLYLYWHPWKLLGSEALQAPSWPSVLQFWGAAEDLAGRTQRQQRAPPQLPQTQPRWPWSAWWSFLYGGPGCWQSSCHVACSAPSRPRPPHRRTCLCPCQCLCSFTDRVGGWVRDCSAFVSTWINRCFFLCALTAAPAPNIHSLWSHSNSFWLTDVKNPPRILFFIFLFLVLLFLVLFFVRFLRFVFFVFVVRLIFLWWTRYLLKTQKYIYINKVISLWGCQHHWHWNMSRSIYYFRILHKNNTAILPKHMLIRSFVNASTFVAMEQIWSDFQS